MFWQDTSLQGPRLLEKKNEIKEVKGEKLLCDFIRDFHLSGPQNLKKSQILNE
jgi:hypothetical protein